MRFCILSRIECISISEGSFHQKTQEADRHKQHLGFALFFFSPLSKDSHAIVESTETSALL